MATKTPRHQESTGHWPVTLFSHEDTRRDTKETLHNNQAVRETGEGMVSTRSSVLLIDDEAVVREIGSEMLEAMGFSCVQAPNGEEGIRLYKENRDKIALVLLDIEMPGISGDRVYEVLKQMNPEVKILLISGYSRNYLEAKYFKRKLSSSFFMSKPFQMAQLSQKVKTLMEG